MFIGALIAVYLVPGPDMLLILHTSSSQGRRLALATALGLGVARAVHVTLAAIGLAALLRAVPWAFEVVRAIGAAYLVWLGIKIMRSPLPALPLRNSSPMVPAGTHHRNAVWRGVLTNVTNPKALLFSSVLLPQFVHADNGSIAGQFLLLGVVLVAIGFLFDVCYALAGAALGRWLERHPAARTVQRWTFSALLVGFGARLALWGRLQ